MLTERDYTSPDGVLHFLVRLPDGDICLGFEGCPSHTHGDIQAALFGGTPEEATIRYVDDLLSNRLTIAIATVAGTVRDIWITDDPVANLRYCPSGEKITFRLWDGTEILA